jgi:hypothetical protein
VSKISWIVLCVSVNTNPYKQNDEGHNANDGENCAHEITSTREYDPNEDDFDPQKNHNDTKKCDDEFWWRVEGWGMKGPSNPYSKGNQFIGGVNWNMHALRGG